MCLLVMSPYSHDFIQMHAVKVFVYHNQLLPMCFKYLHSIWFLDGGTSMLVFLSNYIVMVCWLVLQLYFTYKYVRLHM